MSWSQIIIILETFLIFWLAFICIDKINYISNLRNMYFSETAEMKKDFEERSKKAKCSCEELATLENKIRSSSCELDRLNISVATARKDLQSTLRQNMDLDICILRSRKAPDGVTFASDGYPIYWDSPSGKPYGDYTVYLNSKAGVYHTDHYCAPYFAETTHLFKALSISRPCKRCAKKYENFRIPEWYSNP